MKALALLTVLSEVKKRLTNNVVQHLLTSFIIVVVEVEKLSRKMQNRTTNLSVYSKYTTTIL